MPDIGWSEYLLIFGLALIVLGPEKLPRLVASVGRWIGRARAMARQFRDQLESETESIRSSVHDVKQDLHSTATDFQSGVSDVRRDVETGLQEAAPAPTPEPVPAAESAAAPGSEAVPPPPPGEPNGSVDGDERRV